MRAGSCHTHGVDDAELLEAWRAGDTASGNKLFHRHIAAVYRFFRTKVAGDLDDLVQMTFMRCANSRDDIREAQRFRPYLFAVARNVLREYYRERGRGREVELGSASVADLADTPSALLVQDEEQRVLVAALRQIPLDEQIALELFYWEKLTAKDLAKVLGVAVGTAKTRLRAARLSLEAKIATLARDPALLQSTLDNLERWSASIRAYLDHEAEPQ